jgi:hypothetical protein
MNSIKGLLGLLLCCGWLFAPVTFAGGNTTVSIAYAGTGHDVGAKDEFGLALNWFENESVGTFGKSSSTILSKFAPDFDGTVSCPDEFPLAFDLVRCVTTVTTANLDQLYGIFTDGWLCMAEDRLSWIGAANGVWFDGTGRFDGASGAWTSEYSGDNLEAESGFRTIAGTFYGTLEMP